MSPTGPSALPSQRSAPREGPSPTRRTPARYKDIVSEMNASPKKPAKKTTKQTPPKPARGGTPNGTPPILLSGGNPQIPKGDGDAPVQAYIAAMPSWKRDVGHRLDALITPSVANLRKAVRWNSPFYGVEARGWFLSFHCFTKYVKVTFLRGAALSPLPPVESKDPNVRYLHIHEGDALDEKLLTRWIQQASQLPGDPLF